MNDKKTLRRFYKNKRNELSTDEINILSQKIFLKLNSNFSLENKTIHSFLPIEKLKEVNTRIFIHNIWNENKNIKIVVSKSNFKNFDLQHYYLSKSTKLVENNYGIFEPVKAVPCNIKKIDLVLVPLLCFDKMGNRIGYGKGFYDRFLSQLPSKTNKIGLSFFAPVNQIFEVINTDVKMDYCITPNKIFTF